MKNCEYRILVVDNEQSNREALELCLKEYGYQNVVTISCGREALNMITRKKFDLVIMDVQMETHHDGLNTLADINEMYPEANVFMMSANADYQKEAMALGAKAFFEKPFKINLLIDKIENIFTS